MKILGIESSCDETAAAVVENGRNVLSNVVATSLDEHKLYGGVVPEIASRRHAESISGVVTEALLQANCTLADIEAIAVTYAPGLIGRAACWRQFCKGAFRSFGQAACSGAPSAFSHCGKLSYFRFGTAVFVPCCQRRPFAYRGGKQLHGL